MLQIFVDPEQINEILEIMFFVSTRDNLVGIDSEKHTKNTHTLHQYPVTCLSEQINCSII